MIWKQPFFWLILAVSAGFALLPLKGNDVGLRETLILAAVAIILASNLNLMIGYTGYVNFGNVVFYGLGGYLGLYLTTERGWRLVGDVDFQGVSEVAEAISPVPGGVGPMTITMLLANTLQAARQIEANAAGASR